MGAGLVTIVWANVPIVSRTNVLCTIAFGRPKVAPIDHLDRVGPITPSYAKAQPGSPFLRLDAPARSGRIGLGELPLSMRRSAKLEEAIGRSLQRRRSLPSFTPLSSEVWGLWSLPGDECLAGNLRVRVCLGRRPSLLPIELPREMRCRDRVSSKRCGGTGMTGTGSSIEVGWASSQAVSLRRR